MKVLVLTKYGRLGASSRMRFFQYFSFLNSNGVNISVQPFFCSEDLQIRYHKGGYSLLNLFRCYLRRLKVLLNASPFDLVWIQGEALPYMPPFLEQYLLRDIKYVVDYDDAIFHNYDMHKFPIVRMLLGQRVDALMAKSALVVTGNNYLGQRAIDAGAKWVEIVPTVIDIERYTTKKLLKKDTSVFLRVVWIGSQSTVNYLINILPLLKSVNQDIPFILRVIGAEVQDSELEIENIKWSENTEVTSISEADIGIMPLVDSPWERGKCGYKLIQYMACGLPVIGSGVGVNVDIINCSEAGFVANNDLQWRKSLLTLLRDAQLRTLMGKKGLTAAKDIYSLQSQRRKLLSFFEDVVASKEK